MAQKKTKHDHYVYFSSEYSRKSFWAGLNGLSLLQALHPPCHRSDECLPSDITCSRAASTRCFGRLPVACRVLADTRDWGHARSSTPCWRVRPTRPNISSYRLAIIQNEDTAAHANIQISFWNMYFFTRYLIGHISRKIIKLISRSPIKKGWTFISIFLYIILNMQYWWGVVVDSLHLEDAVKIKILYRGYFIIASDRDPFNCTIRNATHVIILVRVFRFHCKYHYTTTVRATIFLANTKVAGWSLTATFISSEQ